ncbi:MAG: hypothetical protein RL591_51, partial [Planctomycetota bacterium]
MSDQGNLRRDVFSDVFGDVHGEIHGDFRRNIRGYASILQSCHSDKTRRLGVHLAASSLAWWASHAVAAPQCDASVSPCSVTVASSTAVSFMAGNQENTRSAAPSSVLPEFAVVERTLVPTLSAALSATFTGFRSRGFTTPVVRLNNLVSQDEGKSTTPKQPANPGQQNTVEPARPVAQGAENAPLAEEISPKLEEAVQRGFEALRRMQKSDGSFGQGRFGEHVGI